jgi:hypothetical protein
MPAKKDTASLPPLEFHPLTPDRWSDLEALFGARGATGGCWCMWWRLKRADYDRQKGEGNKRAFKSIVESEVKPGILAYADAKPIAWCAVQPREAYPVLQRIQHTILGAQVGDIGRNGQRLAGDVLQKLLGRVL